MVTLDSNAWPRPDVAIAAASLAATEWVCGTKGKGSIEPVDTVLMMDQSILEPVDLTLGNSQHILNERLIFV